MKECIIGIDPGKTGGICSIHPEHGVIELEPMPEDIFGVKAFIDSAMVFHSPIFVFLEKAQSMPGNGVVSMMTYGIHFGELLACMKFSKIPYELVPPTVWTKEMHVGCTGDRPKFRSREAAERLFPDVELKNPYSKKTRIPHEGMVDALLIAEFGRRKRNGS